MSNLEDGLMEDPPPYEEGVEAEPDLGDAEDIGGEAEAAEDYLPQEEYDYIDPEQVAGKYVRLKVDGEEVSVPWEEAQSLAQQGRDYTRKTQDLAEQRREAESALRLAQAIQTNPGLTMQVLANQAGMSVEEFLGLSGAQQQAVARSASQDYEDEDDEFLDPLERQLREERQARMALEARVNRSESDAILRSAVAQLRQQYGATEDEARHVVGQALNMGLGPPAFPMIYQSMKYQQGEAERQAQQEVASKRQAQEAQRRQAAARATQTIGSGAGAAGGGVRAADVTQPMSIREAFDLAYDEVVGS